MQAGYRNGSKPPAERVHITFKLSDLDLLSRTFKLSDLDLLSRRK